MATENRTEINIDQVKAELDTLCKKYDATASNNLLQFEQKHYSAMTNGPESYGRFKEQFRLFFELVNSIVIGLNYIDKSDWPPHRTIQFLFLVNNLRSLHNTTYTLLRGHWEDSMTIMRTCLEAMIRVVWISCYPNRLDAGVIPQKDGGREFNYTQFVKNDLLLKWDDYKMMSLKAHGNQIAVVQDMLKLNKGEYDYPIAPRLGLMGSVTIGFNGVSHHCLSYCVV